MLSFGYSRGIPDGTVAAWGARWIFPDDHLGNRSSLIGPDADTKALVDWLDSKPNPRSKKGTRFQQAKIEARRLKNSGQLWGGEDREVVLYEDAAGIVKANPQQSHGYLYVCAYLK